MPPDWKSSTRRGKDQVEARLQGIEPINPETATRCVFEVVERNIDRAEAAQVKHMLPGVVRTLWPEEA